MEQFSTPDRSMTTAFLALMRKQMWNGKTGLRRQWVIRGRPKPFVYRREGKEVGRVDPDVSNSTNVQLLQKIDAMTLLQL